MKILSKRRRHENKTNYVKRRRLLESRKPRIIIRKTNRYIIIQYAESSMAQDAIKASAFSKELSEYGWSEEKAGSLKSLGAAYLTGLLFGKKAKDKKLREATLDTGLIRSTKGSRVYAAVKGIVDSGFKISHNPEVFPSEDRIDSANMKSFFKKIKENLIKMEAKK